MRKMKVEEQELKRLIEELEDCTWAECLAPVGEELTERQALTEQARNALYKALGLKVNY